MNKEDKKDIEKPTKPRGRFILNFLKLLMLASGGFAVYNLFSLRKMGGSIPKYLYLGIALIVVFYIILFVIICKKLKKQKSLKRNVKKKGVTTFSVIYL